ncbi:MAG: hypothetical protein Q8Q62_10105 [Mesorhizobium sp.]|nr:hypothetical protein [Mesorhizobium sp.]
MLDRIVVLLLAIADLAERAAGAPEARRRLVLAIIRHGDAVARDAFCVSPHGRTDRHGTLDGARDGPEDAMALALSLRVLALMVRSMTARTRRLSWLAGAPGDSSGAGEVAHRYRAITPRIPGMAPRPAQRLDTS